MNNKTAFSKKLLQEIIKDIIIWSSAAFLIGWFWNSWLLAGPHGPYRWIGLDFVPFWVGVQEMVKGLNPYTPEVTLKIQEAIYGGPAYSYDPMMFVYPAWLFALFIPFSMLPLQWAVILYSSTLIYGLIKMISNLASLWSNAQGKIKFIWVGLLFVGSLPFLIISATKGQLGYVSLLGLYLSQRLWAKKPVLAGTALALALIKPTVTVIPVVGLLGWALYEKNSRILLGFTGLMSLLSSVSFIASGFWLPEYLQMLSITAECPYSGGCKFSANPGISSTHSISSPFWFIVSSWQSKIKIEPSGFHQPSWPVSPSFQCAGFMIYF